MVRIVDGRLARAIWRRESGNWGLAKTSALFIQVQVTPVGGCLEMYKALTRVFATQRPKLDFFQPNFLPDDNKGHQKMLETTETSILMLRENGVLVEHFQ